MGLSLRGVWKQPVALRVDARARQFIAPCIGKMTQDYEKVRRSLTMHINIV